MNIGSEDSIGETLNKQRIRFFFGDLYLYTKPSIRRKYFMRPQLGTIEGQLGNQLSRLSNEDCQ